MKTPVTSPELLTVATVIVADTQALEIAGGSEAFNCVVDPTQTDKLPVIVGGVHACCATFKIPVVVVPKKVELVCVAAEVVPPHEPAACPTPPSVNVAAVDVLELANNATAPVMERFPEIVVVPVNVLLPDPLRIRFL